MQRIPALDPAGAGGKTKVLFDAVTKQMGGVPNILKTMGQAPAVLEAYLGFAGALDSGSFKPAIREQIALAVAGVNQCDYCASVHTAVGQRLALSPEETARNLRAEASDPRVAGILAFARVIVEKRGSVDDADMSAIRNAGLGDSEIVEIIGHVALNIFTNYFNHIANTDIDFPVVKTAPVAA